MPTVRGLLLFSLIITLCLSERTVKKYRRWVVDDTGCRTLDKESGRCVLVDQCRSISDLVDGRGDHPATEEQKVLLKLHACGVDDWGSLKVCCSYDDLSLEDVE
ncbi:Regulatory CLIP domain of proteinase [Popillia japonica]|uniref:Regulatory CLIP domain of proteinase n=1 Tax=Popillia japonica TaxID=7064 RepID=A0AAW1MHF5_POPJA